MPIYEYRCGECSHELEKLQRMSEEPLRECPSCGKHGLKRLISVAGFRLKGDGWYETDFKQGSQRNLHDSGNDSSAGDKKSSDKKPETKKSDSASSKDKKTGTG